MARQPRYIEFMYGDPTTVLTFQRHPRAAYGSQGLRAEHENGLCGERQRV